MSKIDELLLLLEEEEWIEVAKRAIVFNEEDLDSLLEEDRETCPCSYNICSECGMRTKE